MGSEMSAQKTTTTLLLLATLAGCAHDVRRFPLAEPLWEDPDRNHVTERPDKYWSGLYADGADMMIFYPLSKAFAFPLAGESRNVNAVDEVPNSAWFTNRIGFHEVKPEAMRRGVCDQEPLSAKHAPWTVIAAKPNGANPGFFIKAGDGRRYLLKFDGPVQPPRPTAADVIGSKFYWAAGYNVPCNEVVFFEEHILKISPEATSEDKFGNDVPITTEDIDKVLKMAFRTKAGLLRASASAFVDGRPIGPFKYQDTRSDDPNDVIPHEYRRELRGNRLLASWLNHFDTREQNTLDVWAKQEGREFIRHYYIDFGDGFGGRWPQDMISRRLGRSYYFDWGQVAVDFLTLGAYPRPWYDVSINEEAEIFGYYGHEHFVPSEWKGGYLNPAFINMDHRDALWMARIISRFTEAHVREAVKSGAIPDPRAEEYLVFVLMQRRKKILEEYLTQYSALDMFQIVRRTPGDDTQSLCWVDLAIDEGLVDWKKVLYKMRFYGGADVDEEIGWLQFTPDPDHPRRSCIQLPLGHKRPHDLAPEGAADDHPLRYGVLKIFAHQRPSVPPTSVTEVHLYDKGPGAGYQLVGIVRPPKPDLPGLY